MSSKACKSCGGTNIEQEQSRGISVCTDCGAVLEENCIVSEVQFEENAYGAASAVGQFLSNDAQGGTGFINSYRGASGKQSREITLRKARDRITMMGHQLNLNAHCIDVACNFYNMALARRLTNGTKGSHLVAACIYLTCRVEGTAHLLIDIADVIDIDVYTLGHTFMRIAKVLNLNIPTVDPCLYIMRYANRMEFGDKMNEVSKTALRLVQRMKRDWIHTGRRPSGLCGAALLIAARHHGFNRTLQDVIKEVKVHETTVRKRMLEFGETASSSLTLEEFMTVDLEEEHDPPCYLKSRKKDRAEKVEDEGTKEEMLKLEKAINKEITKHLSKKRGPWAKHYKESLADDEESLDGSEQSDIDAAKLGLGSTNDSDLDDAIADVTLSAVKECLDETEGAAVESATKLSASPPKKSRKVELSDAELMPPPGSTFLQLREHLRPSMASMVALDTADKDDSNENNEKGEQVEEEGAGELDLEGLDDKELDGYIKSDAEAKATGKVWMALYGEDLKEIEEKRKRKEEEEEARARKGEKRKRRQRRAPQNYSANTPAEAIGKMLVGKRMSNKIDYEKLKDLGFNFGTPAATSTAKEEPPEKIIEDTPIPKASNPKAPKVNVGASKAREKPKEEKPKDLPKAPSPPPVQQEEFYEEEEEYEEEGVQSVRSLMSNFHGDGDGCKTITLTPVACKKLARAAGLCQKSSGIVTEKCKRETNVNDSVAVDEISVHCAPRREGSVPSVPPRELLAPPQHG